MVLERASKENKKNVKYISDPAMEILMNYSWPGNIRELENAVERAVVLCKGDTLAPDLFPIPIPTREPHSSDQPSLTPFPNPDALPAFLPQAVEMLKKRMIESALQKTGGNQRRAAQLLGLTERMIGYKIKQYAVKYKLQN